MTLSKYAPLSHDEIISRLRGQTLHIPNLTTLFSHWPPASKNTNYTTLQTIVHESLTTIAATRPASQRRLNDDIALLTSLGYPHADLPQARILALYVVWLICWDDEVDANEGDMAGDFSKAEAWREETVGVVIAALCAGGAHGIIGGKDPLHDILLDLGKSLEGHYAAQQRQRVADKIILFVRNCATEQKLRLEGKIPSYEEYMAMRIETVAGGTLCSLIEYSRGVTLPTTLFGSSSRDELDRQVSILLSLLNDILSLKKELRTDCVINAVATLMTQEKTLDDVVAEVVTKMQEAVEAFDVAAWKFQTLASTDEERAVATMYIDGCKSLVTGTLEFTLKSPRYNIARLLAEDGSLKILL